MEMVTMATAVSPPPPLLHLCSQLAYHDAANHRCSFRRAAMARRTRSPASKLHLHHHNYNGNSSCGRLKLVAQDVAGARDPFPAEIESNFADKVVGNASTEHVILIPPLSTGLAERSCQALPPEALALPESEARSLLRKIVGWRIVNIDGALRLQCNWKLKNFAAGLELFHRIAVVAEAEGHHPDLHLEQWNKAKAEIWSHSIDGWQAEMLPFIYQVWVYYWIVGDKGHKFWTRKLLNCL
ncbi:hypothetical protein O6H91_14G025000 [Diphasiastrum complanatum]|uniref:Uncharacterized protein n=1 Tax=Diphasiastrum complanatum TaxID=34168 RepID=A0ACC2BMB5_DIPCM|nr:hypothetical protein O6H91_14G025000 [Diphasiastrum complanatum]